MNLNHANLLIRFAAVMCCIAGYAYLTQSLPRSQAWVGLGLIAGWFLLRPARRRVSHAVSQMRLHQMNVRQIRKAR